MNRPTSPLCPQLWCIIRRNFCDGIYLGKVPERRDLMLRFHRHKDSPFQFIGAYFVYLLTLLVVVIAAVVMLSIL